MWLTILTKRFAGAWCLIPGTIHLPIPCLHVYALTCMFSYTIYKSSDLMHHATRHQKSMVGSISTILKKYEKKITCHFARACLPCLLILFLKKLLSLSSWCYLFLSPGTIYQCKCSETTKLFVISCMCVHLLLTPENFCLPNQPISL